MGDKRFKSKYYERKNQDAMFLTVFYVLDCYDIVIIYMFIRVILYLISCLRCAVIFSDVWIVANKCLSSSLVMGNVENNQASHIWIP